MSLFIALVAIVVAFAAASAYIRRASRSISKADHVWGEFKEDAQRIIRDETFPEAIAEFAHILVMTAGCGCYVRQMLYVHFAPKRAAMRSKRAGRDNAQRATLDAAFNALSGRQRKLVSQMVAKAIAFDSFANPLQGWYLRRVIMGYQYAPSRPVKLPQEDMQEAKLAALNVTAREMSSRKERFGELCPA